MLVWYLSSTVVEFCSAAFWQAAQCEFPEASRGAALQLGELSAARIMPATGLTRKNCTGQTWIDFLAFWHITNVESSQPGVRPAKSHASQESSQLGVMPARSHACGKWSPLEASGSPPLSGSSLSLGPKNVGNLHQVLNCGKALRSGKSFAEREKQCLKS